MTDDHAPEGRTAHECFELARIALDQAEQVVNRATTTLECAKAQASASIAIGWARLGDALANEPGIVAATISPDDLDPREIAGWVRRRFDNHDNGTCAHNDRCWVCAIRNGWPNTEPRELGVPGPLPLTNLAHLPTPDHVHSPDCAHKWVLPTEPCAECGQGQIRNHERCPTPCPEPGEWWVHLPGEPKTVLYHPNHPGDGQHECTASTIAGPCSDCGRADDAATEARMGKSVRVGWAGAEPHIHGPDCRHQWIHATAPCANGCGAMPEGFYIGRSPSEVCPKSTCLDVTA